MESDLNGIENLLSEEAQFKLSIHEAIYLAATSAYSIADSFLVRNPDIKPGERGTIEFQGKAIKGKGSHPRQPPVRKTVD